MTEWIKCSDQMPDCDGGTMFLAVNTVGYMAIFNELTITNLPPEVATLTGWLSELGSREAVIGSVTHWQPLPPPPAR